jgi:hypothetical protein
MVRANVFLSLFAVLLVRSLTVPAAAADLHWHLAAPQPVRPPRGEQDPHVCDNPGRMMRCLKEALEARSVADYSALLAANFHFHTTDAFMDSALGGSIDREREIGTLRNLFEGGADTTQMPRADSISAKVGPYEVQDDPEHPDSTRHYQVIAARSFDLMIVVKDKTYDVSRSRHEYRVVRGDAAVLVPGQPADERHWYFWDWIERPSFLVDDLDGGPDALPPGAPPLALRRPPTPLTGALDVTFSLPMTAPATLDLFDVMGRRMMKRAVGGMGPGEHQVRLAEPGQLTPGVYWLRLALGKRVRSEKLIVER